MLIPGPWGCDRGCMRHVLGRESWDCEAWGYRARGGQCTLRMREAAGSCGLLMRLDVDTGQSQAQGWTSHTHVPWRKLLARI